MADSVVTAQSADVRPRAATAPPRIAALVRAVDDAASLAVLSDRLRAARPDLGMLGVAAHMLDAVERSLESGDWTAAATAFARCRDDELLFYLGPMRAREEVEPSMGVVLAVRDATAREAFRVIRDASEELGQALFGFPCSFGRRDVEFYDLQAVAGGPLDTPDAPIALFTPFFFGSVVADAMTPRRTVLWSSVVIDRHRAVAGRVAAGKLEIDGRAPTVSQASNETLRVCAGLWLSLHELFHSSGPLPLFEPLSQKVGLGRYGVVEEARVDMSAFLALSRLGGPESPYRMAAELILLERLLRSARHGAATLDGGREPSLDGQHGLVWAGALSAGGAMRNPPGKSVISIDFGRATEVVSALLGEIYGAESATVDDPDNRARALHQLAARVHGSWLGPLAPGLRAVREWSAHGPTAVTLRPGPLTAPGVSDSESSR